jgi:hypothetical protein
MTGALSARMRGKSNVSQRARISPRYSCVVYTVPITEAYV